LIERLAGGGFLATRFGGFESMLVIGLEVVDRRERPCPGINLAPAGIFGMISPMFFANPKTFRHCRRRQTESAR
jgi:hypothetical protein